MNAAPTLYERLRAQVDKEASGLSLACAKHEQDKPFFPLNRSSLPVENPQVTTSTLCPHVTDPDLALWFLEHPEVVCARCWLKRSKELREDARATKATRRRHASRKTPYRGTIQRGGR